MDIALLLWQLSSERCNALRMRLRTTHRSLRRPLRALSKARQQRALHTVAIEQSELWMLYPTALPLCDPPPVRDGRLVSRLGQGDPPPPQTLP